MQVTFDAARDDFLIAMVTLRMGEKRRDQQRLLHHQSVHSLLLYQCVASGCRLSGRRGSSMNCMGVLCMKVDAVRESLRLYSTAHLYAPFRATSADALPFAGVAMNDAVERGDISASTR
jgi:hypothetical protein